eukprot:6237657-Karenia_brevis.AAC.1
MYVLMTIHCSSVHQLRVILTNCPPHRTRLKFQGLGTWVFGDDSAIVFGCATCELKSRGMHFLR